MTPISETLVKNKEVTCIVKARNRKCRWEYNCSPRACHPTKSK